MINTLVFIVAYALAIFFEAFTPEAVDILTLALVLYLYYKEITI